MRKDKTKSGFTFLEVILVIVLIGAFFGTGFLYYNNSLIRKDVTTQAATFVSYLRLAQSNAKAGLHNTSHGIHLEPDSYTIFRGTSYDEEDSNNYEVTLPATITISNIALNGSGNDIIFNAPHGETSTFGTLDFTASTIGKTITITVTKIGSITY